MRVIGGRLGGRRLSAPKGDATRPTPDRVREALFNILRDVEGLQVLDLCAGSGAVGIEALSRGAAHATFVEAHRSAARVIEQNLEALELTSIAHVITRDVFPAVSRLSGSSMKFELVFVDPPYDQVHVLFPKLFEKLRPLLVAGARLIIEHRTKDPAPEPPSGFAFGRSRRYGDTTLSFYEATA